MDGFSAYQKELIKDAQEKLAEIEKERRLQAGHVQTLEGCVEFYKNAIRKHRDAKGHDRCWLNDKELYEVLGEAIPEPSSPSYEEAMMRCAEYCAAHAVGSDQFVFSIIKKPDDKPMTITSLLDGHAQI